MTATANSTPQVQAESARIAGTLKGLDALRALVAAAEYSEDHDHTVAGEYRKQLADARAFVAALGPLSPEQEGAVAVLAEYIHNEITGAGRPNLEPDGWLPLSVMTDEALQEKAVRVQAENEEFDAEFECEQKSRRSAQDEA